MRRFPRSPFCHAATALGDDLSKLGAADRAGVGHLRGEVFGDGAAGDGGVHGLVDAGGGFLPAYVLQHEARR